MLFRKAEEGDSNLQLRFGMRKLNYRDFYNKLIFFVIGGLISTPFLVWYDWTIIAKMVRDRESGMGIYILLAAVVGFFGGFRLSLVTYQVDPRSRVSGIPFPYILLEFWCKLCSILEIHLH